MKYLTTRQRKRKTEQLFNRIGNICLQTAAESKTGIDLDMDSDTEAEDLDTASTNTKSTPLPAPPTKMIAKAGNKSKQPQYQTLPQTPQEGAACDNRRMQIGFGTNSLPAVDRDMDCYYHRKEPLTLGNFIDLERLGGSQLHRPKSTADNPPIAPTVVDQMEQLPADPKPNASDVKPLETAGEENRDVSVNELLTRLAMHTPYQELGSLTLSMLQNTAFGPIFTGSPSTGGNIPVVEFWPNPYQISNLNSNDPKVHHLAEIVPENGLKPIGYEAKCKFASEREFEQQLPLAGGSGLGSLVASLIMKMNSISVEPHPNSIVEGIKCILKRNRQWENSPSSSSWAKNNLGGNILSITEPQQQHRQYQQHQHQQQQQQQHHQYYQYQQQHQQQQQQQQQQQPQLEPSYDRRSRTVMAASHLYGSSIITYVPLEHQQHGQQMGTAAANSSNVNNFMSSNNSPQYVNRGYLNYNVRNSNSHLQYPVQQLLQSQQQNVRFNYPKSQQQQLPPWQWQQFRVPKPRQQLANRNNKANSYNNNNNNVVRKYCNHSSCHCRYICNNNNINNSNFCNIDQLLLNMSQEDLDAAQMYAIHGERFFDMPMGKRYKFTLHSRPPPPPPPPPLAPPQLSPPLANHLYQRNGRFDDWQPVATGCVMPQHPEKQSAEIASTSSPPLPQRQLQCQVMAPVDADSKVYMANFPPLPEPNQKRVGQNHKD